MSNSPKAIVDRLLHSGKITDKEHDKLIRAIHHAVRMPCADCQEFDCYGCKLIDKSGESEVEK